MASGSETSASEPLLPTSTKDELDHDERRPALSPSTTLHSSQNDIRQKLTVDDMLTLWVGEFGPAQFFHFALSSLAWTLEALNTMLMIFADKTPSWTCVSDATCSSSSSICSMDSSAWKWDDGPGQSTVSEFGLICGEDYKVGLVQSAFFVGAMIGAGVFGGLSDSRLGRKGTLALVCMLNASTGILTAFSPNYWVYFALRAASGFSAGGVGLCSFVLATEAVGPSKRGPVGMSTFYFFSGGIMILSGLAMFSTSWRHLCIIVSLPSVIYSMLVLPFLNESPRWYLVQGRAEDAMKVLTSIASWNRRSLPTGVTVAIEDDNDDHVEDQISGQKVENEDTNTGKFCETESVPKTGTVIDVFKSSTTRIRMLIMVVIWLTVALVYYGISLNVSNLGTDLYLSVLLNALAEVPAFAITAYFLEKFGRRYVLLVTLLLSGACSLIGVFVPSQDGDDDLLNLLHFYKRWTTGNLYGSLNSDYQSIIRLACGVVAIFGMAGAYNLLYIYTAELFPTVVRNAALGLASQTAQIGAIVAPMIVVLGKLQPSLPYAIFCVASFLGAVLSLKLPETQNCPLYETLEGMKRGHGL